MHIIMRVYACMYEPKFYVRSSYTTRHTCTYSSNVLQSQN